MVAGERADEAANSDVRRGSNLLVLGSSAGGIEALSRVVADLPADFPAAVVIAQHLDPRRPSHLAEILERHATLPIKVVEGDHAARRRRHLRRPRRTASSRSPTRACVSGPPDAVPSPRRSTCCSTSAAKAHGDRLIAVILTGTGSDGSAGAWNVKQAGGTVVVENPETAMFPSMPASVSPSLVDAKADLDSIGDVIVGILEVDRAAGRTRS